MSKFYDAFDKTPPAPAPTAPTVVADTAGGTPYARAALEREADAILQAGEGTRNDTLNRAAFSMAQLVAAGQIGAAQVRDALAEAGRRAGLGLKEVEATIGSGFKAGELQPRAVPPPRAVDTDTGVLRLVDPEVTLAPPADDQPAGEPAASRPRTSWWPEQIIDLAARQAAAPAPTHLYRDDGEPLLYSGKVNVLLGESESGKSWLALHTAQQALTDGQRVLFLDFEDNPGTVRDRLLLLGALPSDLDRLDYAHPDQTLDAIAREDVSEALAHHYQLIIVDGVNYAMTLLGLDLNSNTDANLFQGRLLAPLAATGACVTAVDHVPKNTEQRGKGAIGAQAKRAMVDGTSLRVEVVEPFGRGQNGTLKLWVDKDRSGHVRGIAAAGKYAGQAEVTSTDDAVRIRIVQPGEVPTNGRGSFMPTGVMESVSKVLEQAAQPLGVNELRDLVGCKKETLGKAKAELVSLGLIKVENGSNRQQLMTSISPFRESDMAPRNPVVPVVPVVPSGSRVVPGTTMSSGSRPAPPLRGREPLEPPAGTAEMTPVVPDAESACNKCGEMARDDEIEEGHGYCRPCASEMGIRP